MTGSTASGSELAAPLNIAFKLAKTAGEGVANALLTPAPPAPPPTPMVVEVLKPGRGAVAGRVAWSVSVSMDEALQAPELALLVRACCCCCL